MIDLDDPFLTPADVIDARFADDDRWPARWLPTETEWEAGFPSTESVGRAKPDEFVGASSNSSKPSGDFPSEAENRTSEEVSLSLRGQIRNCIRAFRVRGLIGRPTDKDLFHLARWLRWYGVEPTEDFLVGFGFTSVCEELGLPFEATVDKLAAMWHTVRTTPQENALMRAVELADATWREFEVWGVKDRRAWMLALVSHLHQLAPKLERVILPRDKIAPFIGLSEKTTGNIIRELAARGLIAINPDVDGNGRAWNKNAKLAREVKLIGLVEEVEIEPHANPEPVDSLGFFPAELGGDEWLDELPVEPAEEEELEPPLEPDSWSPPPAGRRRVYNAALGIEIWVDDSRDPFADTDIPL